MCKRFASVDALQRNTKCLMLVLYSFRPTINDSIENVNFDLSYFDHIFLLIYKDK